MCCICTCSEQVEDKAFGEPEIKALAEHFGSPKPSPSFTPTTPCTTCSVPFTESFVCVAVLKGELDVGDNVQASLLKDARA